MVAVVRTQEPGTPRFTAIGFFIFYITWMFFILVNIFLAILNDAYGSVMGELQEELTAKRIAREERIAAGLEEPGGGMRQKLTVAQRAARNRMQRYRGQLKRLAKRKRRRGETTVEAVAAGTALGLSYEEVEKLEREAYLRRKNRFKVKSLIKRKPRTKVQPAGVGAAGTSSTRNPNRV